MFELPKSEKCHRQKYNQTVYFLDKVESRIKYRDESRAAARSKTECFVIIVNGWKLLTIITKRPILDVAAVLDPPLKYILRNSKEI